MALLTAQWDEPIFGSYQLIGHHYGPIEFMRQLLDGYKKKKRKYISLKQYLKSK